MRFADDIDGLACDEEELEALAECLDTASRKYGMEINADKTKVMTSNPNGIQNDININDHALDTVSTFKYLGSIISEECSKPDILARQNGTSNSSHDQIKNNMERQKHPTKFQSKTDASPGHFNLPLCMRVLDLDSRAGEEDRGYGNAMLQEAPRHHLPRSGNERQRSQNDKISHGPI